VARAGENTQGVDVLIIDDQSVMRALIRDFLQSSLTNLTIAEAPDGARGMKLVAERRPRVVLMDINLPAANGIELAAQIKALRPETRVIMVTNLEGSAYVERALAAGAFGYVRKDKIYAELLPLVVRALGAAPPDRETGGGE
jgi:DNA-binding NarL/FixJ family response regulator